MPGTTCPDCGQVNDHDGVVCMGCGGRLFGPPAPPPPPAPAPRPLIREYRAWLEQPPPWHWSAWWPGSLRRFCVALAITDEEGVLTTCDGTLEVSVRGPQGQPDLRVTVAVRREEFGLREWTSPMVELSHLSYVYRHPEPVLPARPPECTFVVRLVTARGVAYSREWTERSWCNEVGEIRKP